MWKKGEPTWLLFHPQRISILIFYQFKGILIWGTHYNVLYMYTLFSQNRFKPQFQHHWVSKKKNKTINKKIQQYLFTDTEKLQPQILCFFSSCILEDFNLSKTFFLSNTTSKICACILFLRISILIKRKRIKHTVKIKNKTEKS